MEPKTEIGRAVFDWLYVVMEVLGIVLLGGFVIAILLVGVGLCTYILFSELRR